MKRKTIFLTFLLMLFLLSAPAFAKEISITKSLKNSTLYTGSDAVVTLDIKNPYNSDVNVVIKDKNVFGNNGIDVQCLEYNVPKNNEITLEYSPVSMFKAGKFTLDEAALNYTDPETGEQKTVYSNRLDVDVKDSGNAQGQATGITSIYRCGGVNMQSTSYSSSGGSMSFSYNSGSQQNSQQRFPNNQNQNSHDMLQNNQMNQNANQIKKDIYNQAQQMKEMRKNLADKIAHDPKFQELHSKLTKEGYNITAMDINPEKNNTGNFEINYEKKNGETAKISGRMENSSIKELSSITSEQEKEMLEKLRKNEKFKRLDSEIKSAGLNETGVSFSPGLNMTNIRVNYQKNGSSESAQIKAEFVNGTIKNITTNFRKKEEESNSSLIYIYLLIALVIFIIAFMAYKKFLKKENPKNVPVKKEKIEKPFDWKAESKKLLKKSEKLFSEGNKKEAFSLASKALRLYLSYKFKLRKDLTALELVRELKKRNAEWKQVKKCLDTCSRIEFAKGKPEKGDFENVIKYVKTVIGMK